MRLEVIEIGNAKLLTEAIPAASVSAIVCDPVYWNIDDYEWLGRLATRVLVPGGALLAQVGEPFYYDAETALRKGARRAGSMLVHHPAIVECYHFSTSGFRSGSMNISSGYTPWIFATHGQRRGSVMDRFFGKRDKEHHRWGDGIHFARTYVRVLTAPGDVVLDPFAGGGTVPVACVMTGRHFYACEIDPATAAHANARLLQVPPALLNEEHEQLELQHDTRATA